MSMVRPLLSSREAHFIKLNWLSTANKKLQPLIFQTSINSSPWQEHTALTSWRISMQLKSSKKKVETMTTKTMRLMKRSKRSQSHSKQSFSRRVMRIQSSKMSSRASPRWKRLSTRRMLSNWSRTVMERQSEERWLRWLFTQTWQLQSLLQLPSRLPSGS